jgi:hypothetical protein
VRDVTPGEDANRIRHQPGVFAQLRIWVLNLLRQAGHDNIKAARQVVDWSAEKTAPFLPSNAALNSPGS